MVVTTGKPDDGAGVASTSESEAGVGRAPAAATEPEAPKRTVLEGFKKCSESLLWRLMMSFYDKKGVESWSQGIVPHFITCNAFIGRAYAKVLAGFLRDSVQPGAATPLDPTQPLYIVELGAGSGKFGFFMLRALLELRATCPFPLDKVVYIMTDFTQQNFDFWTEHEGLKEFVESGQLDFALFDAVQDESITLHRSGKVLKRDSLANPLCIVANYLFDTLYHDVFQVSAPAEDGTPGRLMEGLISVGSKQAEEPDELDPEIIKRLHNEFEYRPISDEYYADEEEDAPHFARVLGWYREHFGTPKQGGGRGPGQSQSQDQKQRAGDGAAGAATAIATNTGASILIPIGAMRALRRLLRLAGGRGIVISGDKGHNNPEQFRGLSDPHIAVHGSFSVMVNYHAVGMLFTSRGGFALHNPQEEASLKVSCFVATGGACDGGGEGGAVADAWDVERLDALDTQRATRYPFLAEAFADWVETFGPNDFFVMQKALKEDSPSPSLKSIVALLKLSCWDPDVFYKFRDSLLDQVPTAGHKLRNDIVRGIPTLWSRYYMLDKDKDIAFEVGRLFYGIRDYANALKYYGISVGTIGNHHVTAHNMGLCQYSMGDKLSALGYFDEALGINAKYEKARQWGSRVRRELEAAKATAVADVGVEVGEAGGSGGSGATRAQQISGKLVSVPTPPQPNDADTGTGTGPPSPPASGDEHSKKPEDSSSEVPVPE